MTREKCEYCGIGIKYHPETFHRHCKKAFKKGVEKEKKNCIDKQHRIYNQGRMEADGKWQDADERVEELKKIAGIPELLKLKKDTKYDWRKLKK